VTRLTLKDLPPDIRRKVIPPSPAAPGEGQPPSSPTAAKAARRDIFCCHRCGETNRTLTGAQRHADDNGHRRFEWVCS
jgi:hypothetical protein